jgi:hypothetical protein
MITILTIIVILVFFAFCYFLLERWDNKHKEREQQEWEAYWDEVFERNKNLNN